MVAVKYDPDVQVCNEGYHLFNYPVHSPQKFLIFNF